MGGRERGIEEGIEGERARGEEGGRWRGRARGIQVGYKEDGRGGRGVRGIQEGKVREEGREKREEPPH